MQSAKNDVLGNNFVFYKAQKYTTLSALHEGFSVKSFFVTVFTTFLSVLKFREMQWQIVRLIMVLMFSLWSSFLLLWCSVATCFDRSLDIFCPFLIWRKKMLFSFLIFNTLSHYCYFASWMLHLHPTNV